MTARMIRDGEGESRLDQFIENNLVVASWGEILKTTKEPQ
jgi:hypothetical protein